MKEAKVLHTDRYLSLEEIEKNLDGIEYIIMAEPAPHQFKDTPIHFSIFLNTKDTLPEDISKMVFQKLLRENSIKNPKELLFGKKGVGFGVTAEKTAMPLLLIEQKDILCIPHTTMYIYDFLAEADGYEEVSKHNLTGWSYISSN